MFIQNQIERHMQVSKWSLAHSGDLLDSVMAKVPSRRSVTAEAWFRASPCEIFGAKMELNRLLPSISGSFVRVISPNFHTQ